MKNEQNKESQELKEQSTVTMDNKAARLFFKLYKPLRPVFKLRDLKIMYGDYLDLYIIRTQYGYVCRPNFCDVLTSLLEDYGLYINIFMDVSDKGDYMEWRWIVDNLNGNLVISDCGRRKAKSYDEACQMATIAVCKYILNQNKNESNGKK